MKDMDLLGRRVERCMKRRTARVRRALRWRLAAVLVTGVALSLFVAGVVWLAIPLMAARALVEARARRHERRGHVWMYAAQSALGGMRAIAAILRNPVLVVRVDTARAARPSKECN